MKGEFTTVGEDLIFKVESDDLFTLLLFEEYVERMLIDLRYDTNLEINFTLLVIYVKKALFLRQQ